MRSDDFEKILAMWPSVLKLYWGHYSIDNLPDIFPPGRFILWNRAKAAEAGTHWMIVHRVDLHTIDLFDPLVAQASHVQLLTKYHPINLVTNISPVQPRLENNQRILQRDSP